MSLESECKEMTCSTVLEKLDEWARVQPDKSVWTFLNDKGEFSDSITYQELHTVSHWLGDYLVRDKKLKVGDRVLLVFFPGLQFMITLIACFRAGLIAVPVFPPDPSRLQKDLHHFVSIQQSSSATVVLTHSLYNYAKKGVAIKNVFTMNMKEMRLKWPELEWIPVDDVINKHKQTPYAPKGESNVLPTISGSSVAFLQYTSGSTSEPKGVMISHNNLAHNETIIAKELKVGVDTVCVSWLPQYHDMGLIGSYLGSLYCGGVGIYISPVSFLKDPMLWLRCISKFRGTHTQAPNFAFALVTRKFNEQQKYNSKKPNLDLSSLQHIINAAEPIDAGIVDRFRQCFAPYGLPVKEGGVMFPTYGLAEHCVFVCSGGKQVLLVDKASLLDIGKKVKVLDESYSDTSIINNNSVAVVGCGYPKLEEFGVELIIVEPDHDVICANDVIGEVWINSPSKAGGYWNQLELSQTDFHAQLASSVNSTSTGYLRTGDLGFLHKGELFICGRLKDLIIIRGANHYPQDIERTAESACRQFLRAGCSAAFSVKGTTTAAGVSEDDEAEKVVYVAEVKENVKNLSDFQTIVETCKSVISSGHGLYVNCICLIHTRTIPKTTSGKIARSWCRRGYLEGSLKVCHRWDSRDTDIVHASPSGKKVSVQSITPVLSSPMELEGDAGETTGMMNAGETTGMSAEEAVVISVEELQGQLEALLVEVATSTGIILVFSKPAGSPTQPITSEEEAMLQPGQQLDRAGPLMTFGLDSMTMVQFKGILDKRYILNVPDEFMFSSMASLPSLAKIIKRGGELSEQEKLWLENGVPVHMTEHAGEDMVDVVETGTPLCPWFTCCY